MLLWSDPELRNLPGTLQTRSNICSVQEGWKLRSVQRGGRKPSTGGTECHQGENVAGGGMAFVEIP